MRKVKRFAIVWFATWVITGAVLACSVSLDYMANNVPESAQNFMIGLVLVGSIIPAIFDAYFECKYSIGGSENENHI